MIGKLFIFNERYLGFLYFVELLLSYYRHISYDYKIFIIHQKNEPSNTNK